MRPKRVAIDVHKTCVLTLAGDRCSVEIGPARGVVLVPHLVEEELILADQVVRAYKHRQEQGELTQDVPVVQRQTDVLGLVREHALQVKALVPLRVACVEDHLSLGDLPAVLRDEVRVDAATLQSHEGKITSA